MESIELACPIPVISLALQARFRSRQPAPFSEKLLAAMRNQFGGHEMKKSDT
jgi:6-phosphogluconate dehydrogenase